MTERQPKTDPGTQLDGINGRLVTCHPDELRPHPSYLRHQLAVSASQLSALVERGDLAFREPLVITRDRTIVDGYARWMLARQHGCRSLCPVSNMSFPRPKRFNGYSNRTENPTASTHLTGSLDLENCFRESARSNQRAGGRQKDSSNLTEAQRLDVRAEIAAAARSSARNSARCRASRSKAR